MDRDLTQAEYLVGMAGLGLLRLHRSGDTSSKGAIREELGGLMARLDDPQLSVDVLGEPLDLVTGYGRWASVYDHPGNPVVEHEQPAVWGLLDHLSGDPVLDAACGTGRHLAHLAAQGRRVIGVDLTPEMLSRARTKVPYADLREGDLLDLPVDDAAVAGAVCALALEHVGDLPRAHAELARVVRPGGWVVTSTTHSAIRSILGWGAWFVDETGRGEVATLPQSVSDHINAGLAAGLHLVACVEPAVDDEGAARLASHLAPVATAVAVRGVPVVLVCHFQKPND